MNDIVRTTLPTIEQVRELNAGVVAADQAILQAREAVALANRRRQPLRDRLEAIDCAAGDHPACDPAIVDALVADPTAEPDVAAITATVSAARKATDIQNMQRSVVQEAIDKIGEEVATAQAQLSAAEAARQAAWELFVVGAHRFLVDRFIRHFHELRTMLLEPALALQDVTNPADRSMVTYRAPRLSNQIQVEVYYPSDQGGGYESLFPYRTRTGDQPPHPITLLRAMLTSEQSHHLFSS